MNTLVRFHDNMKHTWQACNWHSVNSLQAELFWNFLCFDICLGWWTLNAVLSGEESVVTLIKRKLIELVERRKQFDVKRHPVWMIQPDVLFNTLMDRWLFQAKHFGLTYRVSDVKLRNPRFNPLPKFWLLDNNSWLIWQIGKSELKESSNVNARALLSTNIFRQHSAVTCIFPSPLSNFLIILNWYKLERNWGTLSCFPRGW